ncbi:hypothetical protein RS130_23235 [Paraglaciecola aquimarina]|uniref:Lipoprotein n=1 Tax=Paraglaciecola aquimarina TaxID=1235557 RepID=A0ABU3T2C7_9ALTE|nr:hypothetical protein [Paraglaciecola aquimarina]MDU0356421.1 hypothetical protein [Paraglaciecola aquimarina]
MHPYILHLVFFSAVSLSLSACIPVLRTEYLSPNWQGTVIDSQTGMPLQGVEVIDLYSQQSVKTDQAGHFELAALTRQFSLKLPVASMSRNYQIEIKFADSTLTHTDSVRITGRRLATTTEPTLFDIGHFAIVTTTRNAPFLLEDGGQQSQLPARFISDCGQPLQDAISLANSARFYQKLWQQQQHLGDVIIEKAQLKRSYTWAFQGWLFAGEQCFRGQYTKSQEFDPFVKSFLQEADKYLD